MLYYRTTFPGKSFPPKMHILEEHVLPFIKLNKHGLGLLGEQGGESMHAVFNNSTKRFDGARNTKETNPDLYKLMCVMQDHLLTVHPSISSKCPQPRSRKRKCCTATQSPP